MQMTLEEQTIAVAAVLLPFERIRGVAEERAQNLMAARSELGDDPLQSIRAALELRPGAFSEVNEAAQRVLAVFSILEA